VVQLIANFGLLVHYLLKTIVASLLGCLNFCAKNLQRFVHLKANLVPLKVLDVGLNLNLFGSASVAADLDVELGGLIQLLTNVVIHLLIPFATGIDLLIVLRENVHELHQLIQGANLKLGFVHLFSNFRIRLKLTPLVSG
jgi:hypothetical protein